IKHVMDTVAANIGDLQRHRRRDLVLNCQVPGIQGRNPHVKWTRRYAYSVRQGKITVRGNRGKGEAWRSLRKVEDRRGASNWVQVLRYLCRIRESEDFAISVA